jgi:hypothetical protein
MREGIIVLWEMAGVKARRVELFFKACGGRINLGSWLCKFITCGVSTTTTTLSLEAAVFPHLSIFIFLVLRLRETQKLE